MGQIALAES
jgi:hypothetical protein